MPKLVMTIDGKEIDVDAKDVTVTIPSIMSASLPISEWWPLGQGPIRPIAYVDGHVTDITVLPYGTAQITAFGPPVATPTTAPSAERSLAAAIPDILAAIRDIREEAQERFDALTALLVDLEDQVKWIADEAQDEPFTAGIGPGVKMPQYEGMTREYQDAIARGAGAATAPSAVNAEGYEEVPIPEGAPIYVETSEGRVVSVHARDADDVLRDVTDAFTGGISDAYDHFALCLKPNPYENRCLHLNVVEAEGTSETALQRRCTNMARLRLILPKCAEKGQ